MKMNFEQMQKILGGRNSGCTTSKSGRSFILGLCVAGSLINPGVGIACMGYDLYCNFS
jgi:hypothetical protein